MNMTLTADVLQDDLALSVAYVMTTANKRATELGVNVLESFITITQNFDHGFRWRVNYGPKDYINHRGGDLIVEVDAEDMTVRQVLRGQ